MLVCSLRQKHHSIIAYLSGLRFAQINHSMGNPFDKPLTRLEYDLTGIKRAEAYSNAPTKPRLPITLELLTRIKAV